VKTRIAELEPWHARRKLHENTKASAEALAFVRGSELS